FVDLHGRSLESMARDYDPIETVVRKPIAVLAAVLLCLCREKSSDATQSDAECTTMAHPSRRDEPHARRADPDPRNDGGARQPPGGVARACGGLDAAPSAGATGERGGAGAEQRHRPMAQAGAGGTVRLWHRRGDPAGAAGALSLAELPRGAGQRRDSSAIAAGQGAADLASGAAAARIAAGPGLRPA